MWISRAERGVPGRSIGIDLNEDRVGGPALANQRPHRRITRVTAVPVRLAVDLHGLEHRRQARRREQHVGSEVGVAEHATTAGTNVGRGNEQLGLRRGDELRSPRSRQDARATDFPANGMSYGESRALRCRSRRTEANSRATSVPVSISSGPRPTGSFVRPRDAPPERLEVARTCRTSRKSPSAMTTAFIAPADVPEIRHRSSTAPPAGGRDAPSERTVRHHHLGGRGRPGRRVASCPRVASRCCGVAWSGWGARLFQSVGVGHARDGFQGAVSRNTRVVGLYSPSLSAMPKPMVVCFQL